MAETLVIAGLLTTSFTMLVMFNPPRMRVAKLTNLRDQKLIDRLSRNHGSF
ncbi:hypothetical protein [Litoreibacter arenae]|uniref:Uncharacterized protein n=1 Tax=Litoreibacter arenae DSM 19593 TaxID=1123360 RepID=S9RLV9_9RHOB|nr:hypothetical protein [Litoreibacter arenae]EPX79080.1 hypothetical protein thalar_01898 [Litoreibacter arenae DSM 19593]